MQTKCELLAPAGGMLGLKAAVHAGADAVYLGGTRYNARINASNFDKDQMLEALDYAHVRNVNVYVTMNTLLSDAELPGALDYVKFLYKAGADALIVQDIGLASLVLQNLPEMKLHLSTQGTVYNSEGAKQAGRFGFSRVVLARELTLEEIRDVAAAEAVDVEVFVHGALCICYSGQCQMSRHIGGRSGNRGDCAQPCRLPYIGQNGKQQYLLSPKDYCTVDYLGELIQSGASSLKIEGRMKSPEYVAIVTSIYRKYIDLYRKHGKYTVTEEDKRALNQIFNRGGFTDGYLHGDPGEQLMSLKMPKHQGVYIGEVLESCDKSWLVDIKLAQGACLKIGDGIEIRSATLAGNVITYCEELAGKVCKVGDIKQKVCKGNKVYKITDKDLMEEARTFFKHESNVKRIPVSLKFKAYLDEFPELEVSETYGGVDEQIVTVVRNQSCKAEKAINKPTTREIIERQLRKTGDSPFGVQTLEIDMDDTISLPLSAINQMRREALSIFEVQKASEKHRKAPVVTQQGKLENNVSQEPFVSLFFYRGEDLYDQTILEMLSQLKVHGIECSHVKAFVPLLDFMESRLNAVDSIIDVIPYILNVSKGRADQYIESNFEHIIERCKKSGISIGNLGWIHRFASRGIFVYGDFGLNIMNIASEQALLTAGIGRIVCRSLESGDCFGRTPLMISEHNLSEDHLIDRKGKVYPVILNKFKDKCLILSDRDELDYKRMKELHSRGKNIRIFIYG